MNSGNATVGGVVAVLGDGYRYAFKACSPL